MDEAWNRCNRDNPRKRAASKMCNRVLHITTTTPAVVNARLDFLFLANGPSYRRSQQRGPCGKARNRSLHRGRHSECRPSGSLCTSCLRYRTCSAWLLLMMCALSRVNSAFRTVPPLAVAPYAQAHDDAIWETLQLTSAAFPRMLFKPRETWQPFRLLCGALA